MGATYDVVIVGGGPGGYQAAIRAGQLGLKVACIEERERLGGTCLNVGCIPSKALLESSERYHSAKHGLAVHGIEIAGLSVNLARMMAHKDRIVSDLGKGIEYLFRQNRVEHVRGTGKIISPDKVSVALPDGATVRLKTKAIVIATGSEVAPLAGVEINEERIVSSTGALSLSKIPKRLAVIGGGVIGLELGSVWNRLGAEITVFELLDRITPGIDAELAKQMQKILEKQGFTFRLGAKIIGCREQDSEVVLSVQAVEGGSLEEVGADVVLVAIGRRANTKGLGLEAIGLELDQKGRLEVDSEYQTSVPGVYAIGDVIAGPMLAHKASEEGVVLMERLAGMRPRVNYGAIPNIVYTWPELATIGQTEEELKAGGVDYKIGRFPFSANSRARTQGETEGLVKVLADARTDRLLGVHMIGPDAGTMIHELAVAMEFGASSEDIAITVHAHPTLPEAIKEAALAVQGRALHV